MPSELRRRFGIDEGDLVIIEERPEGILFRPAAVVCFEAYSPERQAEFLLSNAVDREDYAAALEEVGNLGLDAEKIVHEKPAGA